MVSGRLKSFLKLLDTKIIDMGKTFRSKPYQETTSQEEKERHSWRKRKREIEAEFSELLGDGKEVEVIMSTTKPRNE